MVETNNQEKKEVVVKCDDNCSCVSIDKWVDEPEYYITFYKSYENKPLWFRIADAIKVIRGKSISRGGMVIYDKDFDKLRNF
jgi:hypothetical protein